MKYLILTKEQADSVRGETIPYHELLPVELPDGTFTLPDAVLSDPAHEKKMDQLSILPKVDSVVTFKVVE